MNINTLHKAKSPLWTLIKLSASGLFLYLLFTDPRLSPSGFKTAVRETNPVWLLGSLLFCSAGLCLNIVRWHRFLLENNVNTRLKQSAQSYLAGMFLGFLSPGRLAEFGRGFLFTAVPLKESALITLAEKWYFNAFIFLFGLVGALLAYRPLHMLPRLPYGALLSLLALLTLASFYVILRGNRITFKGLFRGFPTREPGRFYLLTLTNLLFVAMLLQVHCLFRAFEPVHLLTSFATLSLTLTALTLFPITFGNLGVREGCFIFLLGTMDAFPKNAAFSAGLLVFTENILLPSLIGFVIVMSGKFRQRKTAATTCETAKH